MNEQFQETVSAKYASFENYVRDAEEAYRPQHEWMSVDILKLMEERTKVKERMFADVKETL